jgi:hypothetical protein
VSGQSHYLTRVATLTTTPPRLIPCCLGYRRCHAMIISCRHRADSCLSCYQCPVMPQCSTSAPSNQSLDHCVLVNEFVTRPNWRHATDGWYGLVGWDFIERQPILTLIVAKSALIIVKISHTFTLQSRYGVSNALRPIIGHSSPATPDP